MIFELINKIFREKNKKYLTEKIKIRVSLCKKFQLLEHSNLLAISGSNNSTFVTSKKVQVLKFKPDFFQTVWNSREYKDLVISSGDVNSAVVDGEIGYWCTESNRVFFSWIETAVAVPDVGATVLLQVVLGERVNPIPKLITFITPNSHLTTDKLLPIVKINNKTINPIFTRLKRIIRCHPFPDTTGNRSISSNMSIENIKPRNSEWELNGPCTITNGNTWLIPTNSSTESM